MKMNIYLFLFSNLFITALLQTSATKIVNQRVRGIGQQKPYPSDFIDQAVSSMTTSSSSTKHSHSTSIDLPHIIVTESTKKLEEKIITLTAIVEELKQNQQYQSLKIKDCIEQIRKLKNEQQQNPLQTSQSRQSFRKKITKKKKSLWCCFGSPTED